MRWNEVITLSAQLQFEITHQRINRVDTFKPVSDSKNYLYAHFEFLTDEWNGIITAIFTKNNVSYKMLLDNNNECIVPWELLVDGGDISVSCYQDYLITVNTARLRNPDMWKKGKIVNHLHPKCMIN